MTDISETHYDQSEMIDWLKLLFGDQVDSIVKTTSSNVIDPPWKWKLEFFNDKKVVVVDQSILNKELEFKNRILDSYKKEKENFDEVLEQKFKDLYKEKKQLGKVIIENHVTPLHMLKKIMYYKMKMYFDKDFLEQNLFLRFMVMEPDLTFVRTFEHLFTSEEADQASGFTKEMLVSYL